MISSVVLAAGRANRASEQKLLMPLRDKPVLQWVLEGALASDLHEIICVVHNLDAVRRKISLVHERLYWLTNRASDQGQSSSVIAGLWAIDPESGGALFLLGDQPMIKPELINSLLERFKNTHALIEKYRKKTSLVEWDDELSFKDMDVREDYEKMKAGS
jgi:molybdenum cofactor cytidylyltransferase